MEIIIDIPQDFFNKIKEIPSNEFENWHKYLLVEKYSGVFVQAIQNAIPLSKGEWVYREELFDDEDEPRMAYGCSICGRSIKSMHEKGNYCPNCGAKMVELQKVK